MICYRTPIRVMPLVGSRYVPRLRQSDSYMLSVSQSLFWALKSRERPSSAVYYSELTANLVSVMLTAEEVIRLCTVEASNLCRRLGERSRSPYHWAMNMEAKLTGELGLRWHIRRLKAHGRRVELGSFEGRAFSIPGCLEQLLVFQFVR